MKRLLPAAALLSAVVLPFPAPAAAAPLIYQNPTVSATRIAFEYGGDIWVVPREGGAAHRLVTGMNLSGAPYFSPDGTQVAFSGTYDGNTDVYVVSAGGGEPRRLTYHPAPDVAAGWTPDGKDVLFRSSRSSYSDANRLFTISVNGGNPKQLPLDMAEEGAFAPDGTHLAYVYSSQWEPQWQHYRGGQTTPVWIADLRDSSVVKIPRSNSNDRNPMYAGNSLYFLSDRNGPFTLFEYDAAAHAVRQMVENHGFDILSASAGPGAIVYAQLGSLHLFDTQTHTEHEVNVSVAGDMPQVRPHWLKAGSQISNAAISPTGVRAVFEAHGDILTVPALHGDIRNLTQTPGVMERDPAWSPDGQHIAYFSDASGEYTLQIRDQRGIEPARTITLSDSPSFFYTPVWSPDGKKIAYSDKHLRLFYVDLGDGRSRLIDRAPYETFGVGAYNFSWSPDSRWVAYNRQLDNYLNAVFVYNIADGSRHQVTDGMSDAVNPVFDKDGRYLYFLASTNTGLTSDGLDMESTQRPVSAHVYAAVLAHRLVSPNREQSGDEPPPRAPAPKASASPAAHSSEETARTRIDFDGILARIVALPLPGANYVDLQGGAPGEFFVMSAPVTTTEPAPPAMTITKFVMAAHRAMPVESGVTGYRVSYNGKKLLVEKQRKWYVEPADAPAKPGEGLLPTDELEVYTVPREEWAQMYRETWRIERDYFYDKNYGGLNIAQAQHRFAEFLPGLASRDDLTFLTKQMLSYLATGHMWVRGGSEPPMNDVSVGLLGADFEIANGRYRVSRVYNGENWNPQLLAPLTQPGSEVKAGEYILAVNGRQIRADREIYAAFEETAGKQTLLTVSPNADGSGARTVTVTPIANDHNLRNYAWIEDNRRKVAQMSGGKLGYVYLPDTGYGGFTNFNRYFFAQVDKQGVILDERFNHGGQVADYIIDMLSRKPMGITVPRDGKIALDPPLAIYGPKVMIINQYAGSGGDAMPWYFRKSNLGPLVGVRTWGGLVGIGGYPALMDGGSVMAPRIAIGGLHGKWEVEGEGIPPDIEVVQDPRLVRQGHDPQLEAAVQTALRLLREHPPQKFAPPPYPQHHPKIPQIRKRR